LETYGEEGEGAAEEWWEAEVVREGAGIVVVGISWSGDIMADLINSELIQFLLLYIQLTYTYIDPLSSIAGQLEIHL